MRMRNTQKVHVLLILKMSHAKSKNKSLFIGKIANK